jgi:hypothetical protein
LDSGVPPDAGQASGIPDPGTSDAVDQNWGSVGNNSTPSQATPLGTAVGASVSTWVNGNTVGGADTANYFVFRSGPAAGQLSFDICFQAPITSMTATLWTVIGGVAQLPPVGTWNSSATCVANTGPDAPLAASTVYLFEVTAAGGSGMYTS